MIKIHTLRQWWASHPWTLSTLELLNDPPKIWFALLAIVLVMLLFDLYVDLRQHRQVSLPNRPSQLEGICTEEEYANSREYSVECSHFDIISKAIQSAVWIALLFGGVLPISWTFSQRFIARSLPSSWSSSEIVISLVFQGILALFSEIFSLPFNIYRTFWIEAKHGFNKTTPYTFIADQLKTMILTAIFGSIIISTIIWLIQRTGQYFAITICAFLLVFQLVMIVIYPTLIQPLFNKFTPLEEGSLRKSIESLAAKVSFPLQKIYVMDGSKRSSHSNAYFFGFYKNKRIVLFDTLIEKMTVDEVTAVMGHELGHWYHNHMLKGLVMVQANILLIFVLFKLVMGHQPLYSAFGFGDSRPIMVGLALFMQLLSPLSLIASFLASFLSRCREFEADRFANDIGYGAHLPAALIKLYKENKHLIHPDWLYSALHYSHPPPSERIAAMKVYSRLKGKKAK